MVPTRDQSADQRQRSRSVPETPGTDREQDARRHQRKWGLVVEDEFKTDVAILIQDAFRGLLGTLFYLASSVTHDVVIYGREHVSGHHPTIIISNHKRDLDSMVLIGIAYFARGIGRPNRRIAFALREDAFWQGFLQRYLHWPWPFGPLLARISVKPHLHLLKAFPIGYLTQRDQLGHIQAQLRRFARLLDSGRDLYWTPEGGLALDGHLERFRAGLYRVIEDSHAPLRLLPMAVFYDFMTTLRTRCFVRIGSEIVVDRSIPRSELERQARMAILCQMTLNIGHLAAALLRDLPAHSELSYEEIAQLLRHRAGTYRAAGLALDPRLTMRWSFGPRLKQFLGYARRQGILKEETGRWKIGLGIRHPEMRYVLNELTEVETALQI